MRETRSGYTLLESMTVMALVGVLATLAAPSLREVIARTRRHSALNQFAADVTYTRLLAVRSGARAELRLINRGACAAGTLSRRAADGYGIVIHIRPARTVKEVRPGSMGPGVCLEYNNDATLVFNSRGLPIPFENRTVWVRAGLRADSVTISVLGRLLRRY